jgi:beta-glucosidase
LKPAYLRLLLGGGCRQFYKVLKRVRLYGAVKEIIITENGACYKDVLKNGVIADEQRIQYFKDHLQAVLKAKNDGVKIKGYFAWLLTDNFECAY